MNSRGIAIAAAVAGLVAAALPGAVHAQSGQTDKKVKCEGINACKGKGACNTAKNACAGQNACKGQGWSVCGTGRDRRSSRPRLRRPAAVGCGWLDRVDGPPGSYVNAVS